MTPRTRVAILGGGIAGLTAAHELTATPELRERFAVTVYQHGWRLGGKCASGRNGDRHDRIEEHGLHLWFGFYENAFSLMRRCYGELDRRAGAPLATVEEAFRPADAGVLWDRYDDHWTSFRLAFPPNDRVPGDGTPIPDFWEMTRRLATFLADDWLDQHAHAVADVDAAVGGWLDALEDGIGKVVDPLVHKGLGVFLAVLGHITGLRHAAPRAPGQSAHRSIVRETLHRMREWAWRHVLASRMGDDAVRCFFTRLDTMATLIIGIIDDEVHDRGFDALNHEELRVWFTRHGARPVSIDGAMVRACYSGAFAFRDGDPDRPDLAAGVGVQWMLRQILGYKGALVWRMEAGMGDAVMTPLYEVLHRRGVEFRFFHRVTGLRPSADGSTIGEITLLRQVELADDTAREYEPLVPVKGLQCWPSAPRWEQLRDGATLAAQRTDFEGGDGPAPQPVRLEAGTDFDVVVLAISVAALEPILAPLLDGPRGTPMREMLDASATCMTQAFQLWSTADDTALGWKNGPVLSSTYVEPLDTYCDMTHLRDAESWTAEDGLGSIAYFCGVLPDEPGDTAESTRERVRANAIAFLRSDSPQLWPAASHDGDFRWSLLIDPDDGDGVARLDAQYLRANFVPTERYVLSPAGTIDRRLRAEQSGWPNLVLAGDWIRTGVDLGCVEATVMSGMQAARALTGSTTPIVGEDGSWLFRVTKG